jgi:hypothetical protein
MEAEHWVELDPFHTSIVNPVLGDEQVLDVELDRHTVLLPIRRVNASSLRKLKGDKSNKSAEEKMINGQSEPDEPCKQPLIRLYARLEHLIISSKCRLFSRAQIASSPLSSDYERYIFYNSASIPFSIDLLYDEIDVKGRTSVHHIQYKLVSTPNQLISLVPGRRKAIEVSF